MNERIRLVSLFSGIGGFEHGFVNSNLDFELVFSSEIDKHAIITYGQNFSLENMHGNIQKVNEKNIPGHDLLCAGFPCQSFSVAGKQDGFKDIRGTLFFDIVRIIKEKKPKCIFLENVKNLISHDGGSTIKTILKNISNCGYTFDITVINSSEVGVPQNRERTYIVGFLNYNSEKFVNDKRSIKITEIKNWANENSLKTMNFFNDIIFEKNVKYISDILEKGVAEKYYLNSLKVEKFIETINVGCLTSKFEDKIVKEFDLPREVHNDLERQRRVYSIKGISPTILARSDSPKVIVDVGNKYKIRKLTPFETFKIQGFDSKFVRNIKKSDMSDTQLYKQAGNAVSPPVITPIVNKIKELFYD